MRRHKMNIQRIKEFIRSSIEKGKANDESIPEILYFDLLLRAIGKFRTKSVCLRNGRGKTPVIHHVFFHSLVLDPEKAFRPDNDGAHNFEDWFVTKEEFECFLNQVYSRGYVLVRMSQLLHGKIRLPEGKIPLVLSFDDMSYYDYMKGYGFADHLDLEKQEDTVTVLEAFIQKHPDFSWMNARGIIALTGYEGALGYRDPEDERLHETVIRLKKMGFEFACHSWGHHHRIYSDTDSHGKKGITDMEKWFAGVGKAIGKTDIFITPFGVDIRNSPLLHAYLKRRGFRYFCSVGRKHRVEKSGNCYYIERYNIDGITLRKQDYDYNTYYGNVEELYSKDRSIPYIPLRKNATSLVKHALFCMEIPNIYFWNSMGELLDNSLICSTRELFPDAYTAKQWRHFRTLQSKGIRAFDCSGLIKNFMMGGIYGFRYDPDIDYNSAGLLEHAEISGDPDTMPEIPGICLYMQGHVGIYAGNGKVIESTSNRRFGNGVVMTDIKDRVWLKWFYCPEIHYGEE